MDEKEKLLEIISFVSPGTEIRKGLDNILDAGKGALIVVGNSESVQSLIDGGFYINCDYNPQKIYELSKMDGAIILDENTNKIIYANVQMQPNPKIETNESGTRHRTAERVAKQTGNFVISISEKRKRITLYKDNIKYILRNINDIMIEANQAIKTLERYKAVLDNALANLTILEFDDLVSLYEVALCIQRFEMLFRISNEVKRYIIELGAEGRLLNMQFEELLIGAENELNYLIEDYYNDKEVKDVKEVIAECHELNQEELLDFGKITQIIGYGRAYSTLDKKVMPKGYRILGKILRLTRKDIDLLIDEYKELSYIIESDAEELTEIKGITKFKAKALKNGLKRLKMTVLLDKK
ncbi:MAG: DNA integrity scanning protein DisA [Fusobacteria bacterium]|nr:DNA integrity scanning protein DisA [Fusobacteriota bacterium]